MQHWLINNIATFGISFLLTWMLIPQILVIAFRKKLFDVQDARKIHEGIVPRLGGIAFVPAIICSITFIIGLDVFLWPITIGELLANNFVPIMFLFCALLLLFLVGMADDLIGVRYSAKFLFQIIAAALIIGSGVCITNLHGLIWMNSIPEFIGWLITGFIVVYCVNAINLIDGIDGLAAGLAAIAFTYYGIILMFAHQYMYSMLAWAGLGSLLPFLYYNIFGDPDKCRKIFMGDTGSLTIGLLLVFEALVVCNINPAEEHLNCANPLVIGFAPLIVPVFDVARVFYHRIKRRRNPFIADRSHIHHKLLDLGLSSSKALFLILILALIYCIANLWLSMILNINLLLLLDMAFWVVGHLCLTKAIRIRESRLGEKLYD